jgi:hypothetical protein
MLFFAPVLLWLAACLGVIFVWILRLVSLDFPEADPPEIHEPTTR